MNKIAKHTFFVSFLISVLIGLGACNSKPTDLKDLTEKDYYNMYYLEKKGRPAIDPDTIYAITFKKFTGYLTATLKQKDVKLIHSFKNLMAIDLTKEAPGRDFVDSIDFKKLPNLKIITGIRPYRSQYLINRITESTSITTLTIESTYNEYAYNYIDSIPSCICNNKNLKELTIKWVKNIPACIADMNIKKLTFWPMYHGGLDSRLRISLDKIIRKLYKDTAFVNYQPKELIQFYDMTPLTIKGLDTLTYMSGSADSIPSIIKNLKNLKYLKIDGRIRTIPDEINALQNLEVLDMMGYTNGNDYPMTKFPKSLEGLKNLKTLSIHNYSFEKLPPITNLPNLKYLALTSVVGIDSIPDSIEKLQNLEAFLYSEGGYKNFYNTKGWKTYKTMEQYVTEFDSLDLSDNVTKIDGYYWFGTSADDPFYYVTNKPVLQYLSPNIGKLKKLKWLSLGNIKLETLPESIGNLTNLNYFGVENSYLKTLPKSFTKLSPVIIDLRDNQLVSLPDVSPIGKYGYAELSGNQLPPCEAFKFKGKHLFTYDDIIDGRRTPILDSFAKIDEYKYFKDCTHFSTRKLKETSLYPDNEKTERLRKKASIRYLEFKMFGKHKEYFKKLNID